PTTYVSFYFTAPLSSPLLPSFPTRRSSDLRHGLHKHPRNCLRFHLHVFEIVNLTTPAGAIWISRVGRLNADLPLGQLRRALRFGPREASIQVIPSRDFALGVKRGTNRHQLLRPLGIPHLFILPHPLHPYRLAHR